MSTSSGVHRSIDLVENHGGGSRSSALRSTNRVCGSGPSDASTSSITPSTIDNVRSTSHRSRRARGVDNIDEMIAIPNGCVLGQDGDAPFAFEVDVVHHAFGDLLMCANAPLCLKSASTRVVLP